jgi:hypothetical protein
MANSNQLTMTWRDIAGTAAKCGILIAAATIDPSGAAVAAFRAAIAAVSAALNTQASLSFYGNVTDTPAAGSFGDNEDKVMMTFADADGNIHNYKIPGPLESIFQSDKQTVDGTNANVLTYTAAMLAGGVTKAGRPLTEFRGGKRMRIDRKGR